MVKTTVYLSEEEAQSLRRAARATGKSQSELIREGVRSVANPRSLPPRVFHSMAAGRSDGKKPRRWTSDELYRKVTGQR